MDSDSYLEPCTPFEERLCQGWDPMLPVVQNEKKSVRVIAVTTILMVLFSIFPFFLNEFGIIYVLTATVFGAPCWHYLYGY